MSVFAGVKFFLSNRLSMEDHRNLRKIIADQGGQIVEQPGDSKCFHVLPLFTQPDAEAELRQYQKELLPIIGPPCVVEAAERRHQLPDREAVRRRPLYSRLLLGAVVCITGLSVETRETLHQRVMYMGGKWDCDFTIAITHMLAQAPGSEKYRVAVQRGRPALVHPTWLIECWKQQTLLPIDQFPVQPFAGFTLTVTGLTHDEREKIKQLCVQHGGTYSSDLNKSCTHLIVERPGSKKHQYALLWGTVKVVHPRWLYESVEKRVCLNENDFPVVSAESQSQTDGLFSSGTVDSESQPSQKNTHDGRDDETERGRRQGGPKRSPVMMVHHSIESERKRKRSEPPASKRSDRRHGGDEEEVKSSQQPMVRRLRQSKAETPSSVTQDAPYTLCSRDTMASVGVLQVAGFQGANMLDTDSLLATLPPLSYSPFESPSLFKGISFLCKGFDSANERREIKKLLEDHGGTVLFEHPGASGEPAAGTYVLYELAPHGTPGVSNQPLPLSEGDPPRTTMVVTPQWVQRCIQDERVLDPMEMPILFTPLPHPLPLPKPPLSYLISITGFAGVDRENLKGLVESMGFSYTDRFTKKTTHLICKEANGDKFVKAKEWQRAAIVGAEWLLQSAKKGKIQDTKRFTVAHSDDVMSVNRKFEERQRDQAKFNKLGKDRSITVLSDSRSSKERTSTKSTKRRSSAASSATLLTNSLTLPGAAVRSEPFLSDVTILVSKKLEQQQAVLHDLVASMGGTFAYMFDTSITHFILEGRGDMSKELRLVKAHKHIKIVSPLWLHACKRLNARVDENEYPHTMNPRMTLGLDFKSPALVSVKKEKRETDDLGPVQPQPHPLPPIIIKHEVRDEDFSNADTNGNYYSQSQQHSHRHQEERDEDLFVPPTQQPSDSAYRVPLTMQHRPQLQHRPQSIEQTSTTTTRASARTSTSPDRDEDWGVDRTRGRGEHDYDESEYKNEQRLKRSRSRIWQDSGDEDEGGSGGENDDEPARTRRGREYKDDEEDLFEYKTETKEEEEEPLQKYEVMVGCTPDVRPGGGAGVSAATPYFWQAGATTATAPIIKIEERSFGEGDRGGEYQGSVGDEAERRRHASQDSDVGRGAEAAADADVKQDEEKEDEEEEEEEEESEGSGHSAIIQQLLQKNKAGSTGQMRISPLLRMQPKTSSFMLESITRTVARSETMMGKDYNRSLSKFSSSTMMFKPPMSKDILPSQTEEEEDPSDLERRYTEETDSQVVKYAFPLEQAAQDLLFSLAEESMDTEGGVSAAESASEREGRGGNRKRKTDVAAEETRQRGGGSEAEAKRRRRDDINAEHDDEATAKIVDPSDGKEPPQVTESPWSSRGSGVGGSGPNRGSGSLDRSLGGKSYVFMFTAFNSTSNKMSPVYLDTIRELGGHVLDAKFFHPRCTHVVMAEPVRTEKSLAACAAGIWLLKPSYLAECVEMNMFVDESKHVWAEQDVTNEVAQQMIASSRRWRAEVIKRKLEQQQSGRKDEPQRFGAFAGWRAIVVHSTDSKRGEGLKRLIEAGGGEICPASLPLPPNLTMAFFNDRPDESSDLIVALRRAKVPTLTAEYIGDFLTHHPQPATDRYNFASPAFAYNRRPRSAASAAAATATVAPSASLLSSATTTTTAAVTTAASTAAGVKKLSTRTVTRK